MSIIKMGSTVSSIFNNLFGKRHKRILMVGLDGAGKTTILYSLKLGKFVQAIPTIGHNIETVEYKNISFTICDAGRKNAINFWHAYYQNIQGIMFVIDSSDHFRINEVSDVFSQMMAKLKLNDAVVLVFANKQDLPNALSTSEIAEKLQLHNYKNYSLYIQPTSVVQNTGICEGLDWLSKELSKK